MRVESTHALEQLLAKAKKIIFLYYEYSDIAPIILKLISLRGKAKTSSNTNQSSYRPGESEHQMGFAIDWITGIFFMLEYLFML